MCRRPSSGAPLARAKGLVSAAAVPSGDDRSTSCSRRWARLVSSYADRLADDRRQPLGGSPMRIAEVGREHHDRGERERPEKPSDGERGNAANEARSVPDTGAHPSPPRAARKRAGSPSLRFQLTQGRTPADQTECGSLRATGVACGSDCCPLYDTIASRAHPAGARRKPPPAPADLRNGKVGRPLLMPGIPA
jgi:hypothetical protein